MKVQVSVSRKTSLLLGPVSAYFVNILAVFSHVGLLAVLTRVHGGGVQCEPFRGFGSTD